MEDRTCLAFGEDTGSHHCHSKSGLRSPSILNTIPFLCQKLGERVSISHSHNCTTDPCSSRFRPIWYRPLRKARENLTHGILYVCRKMY